MRSDDRKIGKNFLISNFMNTKSLFFVLFFLFGTSVFAQENQILLNGTPLKGKVSLQELANSEAKLSIKVADEKTDRNFDVILAEYSKEGKLRPIFSYSLADPKSVFSVGTVAERIKTGNKLFLVERNKNEDFLVEITVK